MGKDIIFVREAKKECRCRSCDKTLMPNKDRIAWAYNLWGKRPIILCRDCITKAYNEFNQ